MNNKITILGIMLLWSFIIGCDVDISDDNLAEDAVGRYAIIGIDSSQGVINPSGNDDIVITRVNDNTVDVIIDYADASASDITLDNVALSNASNGDIDLDKTFSNATVTGYVNGPELRLRLDYTNGDFIDFDGME